MHEAPEARATADLGTSRLEHLLALTAALSRASRPADVVAAAVTWGAGPLGPSVGAAVLPGLDGSRVLRVRGSGPPSAGPSFDGPPDAVVEAVIATRRPTYHRTGADLAGSWPRRPHAGSPTGGPQAGAVLPLPAGDRVLGVLAFAFASPQAFGTEDQTWLRVVAKLCAQALERLRALDAERQAYARSARLQELAAALSRAVRPVDVIEAAVSVGAAALGATGGAVALLDETGRTFELVAGPGISPRVAADWQRYPCEPQLPAGIAVATRAPCYSRTRAEYVARDPRLEAVADTLGIQADATLPLLAGDRVLGVLSFVFAEPSSPDDAEDRFLRTVSELCGQALERARLFDAERAAREALAASHADARLAAERVELALAAGAILGTWDWDVPADRFSVDRPFAELFGLDPAWGRTGLSLDQVVARVHPDDLGGLQDAIADVLARGGPYRHRYRVHGRDGRWRWIEANGRVDLGPDGRAARFPGVLLDVERHRTLEAERDRATRLLRAFVEAVPGVVYAKDRDGRMMVANRGVAELVGKPPEAILGHTDLEFLEHKEQAATVMETDRRVMHGGRVETLEEVISFPDGRRAVWLSTKAPFLDADGRVVGLIGSSVDITALEAAQAALAERTDELARAQLRLQLALSAARMGVWDWSPVTGEAHWNDQMFEILGLPATRDRPARGDDFLERVHPEDRPRIDAALARALADGADFDVEVRVVGGDHQVRWVLGRGLVLLDGAGRPERMVGVNLDITARKAAEQALHDADRRRNEFLAMLGHELRNPLAPIANAVRLMERSDGAAEHRDVALQIIRRQSAHMARLVDDLLEVSRVTQGRIELRKENILLATAVASAVESVRPLVRERRQTLEVDVAPDVDVVADPARLIQVVANLLNNAAKYTQPGGHLAVHGRAVDDRWAEVAVQDDGPGIEPSLLPRVFDLFEQGATTLDRARGGLGLGLTLVRRLVEMHGGEVQAASPGPGFGARFTVRLPRNERRTAPRGVTAGVVRPSLAPTTVLVVDDNADAVASLVMLLTSDGHRVERAHDGVQALAVAERFRPRVVLLDIGLPGRDGWDVARTLRGWPSMARAVLVAVSGYGQEADRERSRAAGFDAHLLKPVDLHVLYGVVAEADARRGQR